MPKVVQLRSCGEKPLKKQKSLKRAFICAFSRMQVCAYPGFAHSTCVQAIKELWFASNRLPFFKHQHPLCGSQLFFWEMSVILFHSVSAVAFSPQPLKRPVEAGHPSETRSLKIYWLTVMQWCRLTILQPHIEDKVSKGELSSCQLGNHMASLQVWETACTRVIRSSVCILWYIR